MNAGIDPKTGRGPVMPRPRRVLQVGVSYQEPCGIGGYARIVEDDLRRRGCSVASAWWERDDDGSFTSGTLRGLREWGRTLDDRLSGEGADVVLWHYSVFGYGWRGIPVFAAATARRLARGNVPVVVILHEFGHPWWWPGWRGAVFAVTHRLALIPVLRAASSVVVTTEERQRWILDRWWLPSTPPAFSPVFSTVGAGVGTEDSPGAGSEGTTVGVFGYAAARMRPDIVLAALRALQGEGRRVSLSLVGAPGPHGAGARRWQRAADEVGGIDIAFTGALDPAALSQVLVELDVVVFPDEAGPTSRKTTLAALLAHGCCVVALDGSGTWKALVDEGAVVLSSPETADLAAHIGRLLADGHARRAQGRRASDFYDRHLAPDVIVDGLWPLLFPPQPAAVRS
jgi:glycosyltransferase involved in cell wall biosynthesis